MLIYGRSIKKLPFFIDEIPTQFRRRFCIGKTIQQEFDLDFKSMIHKAFLLLPVQRRSVVKISSGNFSLPVSSRFVFDFDVDLQLGREFDLDLTRIRRQFHYSTAKKRQDGE